MRRVDERDPARGVGEARVQRAQSVDDRVEPPPRERHRTMRCARGRSIRRGRATARWGRGARAHRRNPRPPAADRRRSGTRRASQSTCRRGAVGSAIRPYPPSSESEESRSKVPDQRDAAARAEDACELARRVVVREPMKRLKRRDEVRARVFGSRRVGEPIAGVDPRVADRGAHLRVRFERDGAPRRVRPGGATRFPCRRRRRRRAGRPGRRVLRASRRSPRSDTSDGSARSPQRGR